MRQGRGDKAACTVRWAVATVGVEWSIAIQPAMHDVQLSRTAKTLRRYDEMAARNVLEVVPVVCAVIQRQVAVWRHG